MQIKLCNDNIFLIFQEIYPGQFKPSLSHRFIQQLESNDQLLRNYSQNIDTLEQVAGITRVIQCHGQSRQNIIIILVSQINDSLTAAVRALRFHSPVAIVYGIMLFLCAELMVPNNLFPMDIFSLTILYKTSHSQRELFAFDSCGQSDVSNYENTSLTHLPSCTMPKVHCAVVANILNVLQLFEQPKS